MLRYLLCLPWLLLALSGRGQSDLPQGYFRNPLEIPISLAGGFGECRPNHFHTGIDLKTNQRENLKVLAAAEGYVSRVSISHTGYGNAVYVAHPNGYTTVYGHLNSFFPALQQWVTEQQYLRQSWAGDFFPSAAQFPLKQGELLALSGNTGGSTGPHLHFEIRNTSTGETLNPLLFGFEVADSRPPKVSGLALYNAAESIYEQEPALTGYSPDKVYTVDFARLAIGVEAKDYTDNSLNWLGIYEMKLFQDEKLQFATRISRIDLNRNRYMNAYADFRVHKQTGQWYQLLYRLPGNLLDLYSFENDQRGAILLEPGRAHAIRIELSDPMGNTTRLRFKLRYTGKLHPAVAPAPDSFYLKANVAKTVATPDFQLQLPADALYDDVYFRYSSDPAPPAAVSRAIRILGQEIPLHNFSTLKIKLSTPLAFELRQKLAIVHPIKAAALPGNHPQTGMAATYESGWAVAAVRTFGAYHVIVDTLAPLITPLTDVKGRLKAAQKRIEFRVDEETTSIAHFSAHLDGKWLLFTRKGNRFVYEFDDRCPPGPHELVVRATDENDNLREARFNFIR